MAKNNCSVACGSGFTGNAVAQTLEFRVNLTGAHDVPPNDTWFTGSGTLTLNESVLTYLVFVPYVFTEGAMHGPAGPGTNGPVIFPFGGQKCAIPNPPALGGCIWEGGVTLTSEQADQLMAGLWYVAAQ